jgi:hypothetical protein
MATEAKKATTTKAATKTAPKAASKTNGKTAGKAASKTTRKATAKAPAKAPAMSSGAKEAMHRIKMQAASEIGVNLKQGYNGDLTARQAGRIGGLMVKKMIQAYGK